MTFHQINTDTLLLGPSASSTGPDPKWFKPATMTDMENMAEQTAEDTSLRTPATSHPLDPDAEETVLKQARVARNVHHVCSGDELKFDVNEKDWSNAELGIRARYAGALIDGLPADTVKVGDWRTSWWKLDLTHRWGTTDERKRGEIPMCPDGFCDDSKRRCICTDAISNVCEETSFVCSLERSPCGDRGPPHERLLRNRRNVGSGDCMKR